METETNTSGTSEAARRERRRRRILENSERRMKLILGQATEADEHTDRTSVPMPPMEEPKPSPAETAEYTEAALSPAAEVEDHIPGSTLLLEEVPDGDIIDRVWNLPLSDVLPDPASSPMEFGSVDLVPPVRLRGNIGIGDNHNESVLPALVDHSAVLSKPTYAGDDLILVGAGFLVRLLLSSNLGVVFLQCAILPFVLLEASMLVVGGRAGIDIETKAEKYGFTKFASSVTTILSLAGVHPAVHKSLNATLGLFVVLLTDFALYFVTFCVAHLILPVR